MKGEYFMGFFSGLWEGIKSVGCVISGAINKCVEFGEKAISALGKVAGKIAVKVLKDLAKIADKFPNLNLPMLISTVIVDVIMTIAEELQIIKKKENPAELAYRMEEMERHPEWKHREDFDSMEAYIDYMKEKVPDIDQEKMKKNSLVYQIIGTAACYKEIQKKLGIEFPDEFLIDIGRCKMSAREVQAFINTFKNLGYSGNLFYKYLHGMLPFDETQRIKEAVIKALQTVNSNKDRKAIVNRLDEINTAVRNDEEVYKLYQEEIRNIDGK